MITLLRSCQRRCSRRGKQAAWHSLPDPAAGSRLGPLVALDEIRLPPGERSLFRPAGEAEVVTYLYRGTLSLRDPAGHLAVMHAGEFQRASAGGLWGGEETSVSPAVGVHLFRIRLRPGPQNSALTEQRRFTAAQRRNLLCLVASPDGRQGSLRLYGDVRVCSAIVDPGYHLVYALEPAHSAWLHLVYGEATLEDLVLTAGDGAAVADVPALSLTTGENSEMLLIDVGSEDRSSR